MRKILLLCFSLLLILPSSIYAQQSSNAKKIIIGVVWVPELKTEVFTVDDVKFYSIESLKEFLASQSAGTVVVWDPGCVRIGENPLLSSAKELKDFSQFLEKIHIKFVVIPSG